MKHSHSLPHNDNISVKYGDYRFSFDRSKEPTERGIFGSRIYHMYINGWDDEGRYGYITEYDCGWYGKYEDYDEDLREAIEDIVDRYGWEGYRNQ